MIGSQTLLSIFFGIIAVIVLILLIVLFTSSKEGSQQQTRQATLAAGLPVNLAPATTATTATANVNIPICRTDADCAPGLGESSLACISGRCQPRTCRVTDDCLAGENCRHGQCQPISGPNIIQPCSITSDCSGTRPYCVSGFCSATPATPPNNAQLEHETCTTDGDCATGNCMDSGAGIKYCNYPNAECFYNHTGTTGNYICPAERPYCVRGKCTIEQLDAPCLRSEECATGKCINGKCTNQEGVYGDFCASTTDCGPGLTCSQGKCLPRNYQNRRSERRRNLRPPQSLPNTSLPESNGIMGTGLQPGYARPSGLDAMIINTNGLAAGNLPSFSNPIGTGLQPNLQLPAGNIYNVNGLSAGPIPSLGDNLLPIGTGLNSNFVINPPVAPQVVPGSGLTLAAPPINDIRVPVTMGEVGIMGAMGAVGAEGFNPELF